MDNNQPGLLGLVVRTIIVHTVTYFVMGMLASTLLGYAQAFASPWMACWMRQTDDPIVMAGPLFQPIRGLIFALAFYPLRQTLFGKKNGWLVLWWLLVALGILSTFGPAPGSVEGLVYTVIPISQQMRGWLEVVPQALLLSVILFYWVNHPHKRWLNWLLGVIFVLMLLLPALGLLVS
ncbi:MAG TPA: hypothetical protein VJ714_00740 [Anaerolineae bacterium]|jgi:hypothetical protein|nr:hypothetical protein [Anaerolineae bacterium]